MNKQLMDIVLPRLARPLYRHLERYWDGELDDNQFTEKFEDLLRQQHAWLARKGIPEPRAAIAIHAGLLVLSMSGLKAEAEEAELPFEVVEFRAIKEAASDVAQNYGVSEKKVMKTISRIVARYGQ